MVELETRFGPSCRRATHWVNRKPASNLYHAVRVAERIGLSLNLFVTVNFNLTAASDEYISERFETLRRNHFSPWLRRKARSNPTPATYVWVLERGGGCIGLHWLLHIPETRRDEFEDRLPQWLSAVGASCIVEGAIKFATAYNPRGLSRYLLKGIDPHFAEFYGIRASAQGVIYGRRSGFSRNLGPTVRARLNAADKTFVRRFYTWPHQT